MKVPCTISYIGLVRKPCGKSPAAFGAAGALTSMPPGSLPGQHVLNDLRVLSTGPLAERAARPVDLHRQGGRYPVPDLEPVHCRWPRGGTQFATASDMSDLT